MINPEKKYSEPNIKKYICNCGKEYMYRQGLWKHKINCINSEEPNEKDLIINNINNYMQNNIEITKELTKYLDIDNSVDSIHLINNLKNNIAICNNLLYFFTPFNISNADFKIIIIFIKTI